MKKHLLTKKHLLNLEWLALIVATVLTTHAWWNFIVAGFHAFLAWDFGLTAMVLDWLWFGGVEWLLFSVLSSIILFSVCGWVARKWEYDPI